MLPTSGTLIKLMQRTLATLVVLLILGLGYWWWPSEEAQPPTNRPSSESSPIQSEEWFDSFIETEVGLFNPVTPEMMQGIDPDRQLEALGYVQGYLASDDAGSGSMGVVVHDADRVEAGYNLYSSAHTPSAQLMNMQGEVVHSWQYAYADACPDSVDGEHLGQRWIRRVKLLPGGELLALFDYAGLIKLDKDSNLLWAQCRSYHHDIELLPGGRILTLEAQQAKLLLGEAEVEGSADWIVILNPDGSARKRVSLTRAFSESSFKPMLKRISDYDVFHTNSAKWLGAGPPTGIAAFDQRGSVLLSLRNIHTLAVVDLTKGRVTWASEGDWRAQHEATRTATGSVLFFDNLGRGGRSRVVELDPQSNAIVWSYGGGESLEESGEDGGADALAPHEADLYSPVCGSVRRLPRGNTLITESTAARVLEVTPEKQIVWEYRSPHRVEVEGESRVAMIADLVRIDATEVEVWLPRDPGELDETPDPAR